MSNEHLLQIRKPKNECHCLGNYDIFDQVGDYWALMDRKSCIYQHFGENNNNFKLLYSAYC